MKVYTITLHSAHNFGAMLQAYALRYTVEKMGHDAQVIDYTPARVRDLNRRIKWSKNPRVLLKSIRATINYSAWKRRYQAFEKFKKENFHLTKRYYTYEELKLDPPKGDAYLCGSDQIWNPERPFKPEFFLEFGSDDVKRIAYAASFGVSSIPAAQESPLSELLEDFDGVGIRESTGVEIVKSATSKDAELVIDPTLLLDASEWSHIIKSDPIEAEDYMLVYCLEESPLFMRAVEAFAKHTKLPVVVISGSVVNRFKSAKKVHIGIGPVEFLRLFVDASLIVTNSFHGTAFALNFSKRLVCVPHMTRNDRMSTLLASIGWADTQCDESCNVEALLEIADQRICDETSESLKLLRSNSLKFLETHLDIKN